MNGSAKRSLRRILWPHALTPSGLAMRGTAIILIFMALHFAGFGESVSFISGTSPTGAPLDATTCLRGGVYILWWLVLVMVAPILILAGGLLAIGWRVFLEREP